MVVLIINKYILTFIFFSDLDLVAYAYVWSHNTYDKFGSCMYNDDTFGCDCVMFTVCVTSNKYKD